MSMKLYVGSMSFNTTEDGLREAFSQAGTVVSASVVMDKMTGRPRGFGFVEMETDEAGNAAMEMWNGKELDGRTIIVNEARPMTDRPRREFGGGGGGDRGGSRDFGGRRERKW